MFKELAGIEAALAQTAHVVKGKKVNENDIVAYLKDVGLFWEI